MIIILNGANHVPGTVPVHQQVQCDYLRPLLPRPTPPKYLCRPLLMETWQAAQTNPWRHEIPEIYEPVGQPQQATALASTGVVPRHPQ